MIGRATSAVLRRSFARSAATTSAVARSAAVSPPSAVASAAAPSSAAAPLVGANRSFSSAIEENLSAKDAWQKSCYVQIDYTISEDATVYDCIQRFAAYDIGCLVTVDSQGAWCFSYLGWIGVVGCELTLDGTFLDMFYLFG